MLKKSVVNVDGQDFERVLIKTKVVDQNDSLKDLLSFAGDVVEGGDILFISEKVISIIEGRVVHVNDVKPSKIATFLSSNVSKTPGANLTDPRTMQVAIDEVGLFKILFASAGAVLGKLFKRKGWFYIIAGDKVRGIDAPDEDAIPPFNEYISLSPTSPNDIAVQAANIIGVDVCILDANYRGVNILGSSISNLDEDLYRKVFKDNPMGQKDEQTPLCIVRKI